MFERWIREARFAPLRDMALWRSLGELGRHEILEDAAQHLDRDFAFEGPMQFACGGVENEIGVFRHRRTSTLMHLVPGGIYIRGGTPEEQAVSRERGWFNADMNEIPAIPIEVTPFLIGRFLITEGQWRCADGFELYDYIGDQYPAEAMSRTLARDWCSEVGLALPTESQWEYACRAGTQTVFYWGDEPAEDYVWNRETVGEDYGPRPAAEHMSRYNAFGLIDMLGNVAEWVADDVHDYSLNEIEHAYFADYEGADGLQRGGDYVLGWNFSRCASRIQCADYGDSRMGFRAAYWLF